MSASLGALAAGATAADAGATAAGSGFDSSFFSVCAKAEPANAAIKRLLTNKEVFMGAILGSARTASQARFVLPAEDGSACEL